VVALPPPAVFVGELWSSPAAKKPAEEKQEQQRTNDIGPDLLYSS